MSNERNYEVVSPVQLDDGSIVKSSGSVTLPEPVARRLLAMSTPPIVDPGAQATEPGEGDKPSGDTTLTEAQIVHAIGQLDPANKAHFTKGNKPEITALEALLGKAPTAAERDEAWKVFQERKQPD